MIEAQVLEKTVLALLVVFGAGSFSFAVLRWPQGTRIVALACLEIPVFSAPLLVPLPFTGLRLIVSLASIMVGIKLYDLERAAEMRIKPGVWQFVTYLPNACDLVLARVAAPKGDSRPREFARALWLMLATIICAQLVIGIWTLNWRAFPRIVEHCVKVIAICGFIQFGSNIISSGWRLIGVAATDFSGWFFAAATPAEFWRRWNRPAGQFMCEYVFLPAGGSRRPFVAVIATFAFNGLVHEYVFGIAAGRVLGWAMAFFLIQGLVTAATMRVRPRGWRRGFGIALALVFNLVSSALFFRCVDAVVPFYVRR